MEYTFEVNWEAYRRWYASRDAKEIRRGFRIFAAYSTVFMLVGVACLALLLAGRITNGMDLGVWIVFGVTMAQWVVSLIGLARPRLVMISNRRLVERWYASRGVNVEALKLIEPDYRQWSVTVRGNVTDLGVEETMADGYPLRVPFAVLDPHAETIDGALCYRVAADKEGLRIWRALNPVLHFPTGLINGTVVVPICAIGDPESFQTDVARRIEAQRKSVVAESTAAATGKRAQTPVIDDLADWTDR
ncbi:hypothetical protein [Bifidobacterium vespertilionis]|uniref:hypothetical protein n=1 Tax=Bifidobacterium vespertilionis TaxID=2562524 RepID=UPI001BDBC983|nr:hypothetical protein [Bifidobacterium vespertilionis]MBT1179471.1 hypothetical protein [Bifidobacterium vespertilionis]